MQAVAGDDGSPQRSLLAHLGNSGHRKRLRDGEGVKGGEFIPQLPPAINISVRQVEDLLACSFCPESPQSRAAKQFCVGRILESVPSLFVAWKSQGQPELASNRSVSGKTGDQVHWRVQAWPHHQVRSQHRPTDTVFV